MPTTYPPMTEKGVGRAHARSPEPPGQAYARSSPTMERSDRALSYSVRDLMRDQRLAMSTLLPSSSSYPDTVDVEDGRMLLIHTRAIRGWGEAEHELSDAFSAEYGKRAGASHLSKLRVLVAYLENRRSEILWNGLGEDGDPTMIREELVDFLLRYEVHPDEPEIPEFALMRFLADWGHRWM